jgi:hypothetical protein
MASDFTADEIRVLKAIAGGILGALGRGGAAAGATSSASGGEAAPDADLDGQYGDPTIKFDPKRWSGASYVGSTYSRTEPDYLDAVAEALEWSANNPRPGKEKYASYDRRDAARARGWAARLRKEPGRVASAPAPAPKPRADAPPAYDDAPGDDEIPF